MIQNRLIQSGPAQMGGRTHTHIRQASALGFIPLIHNGGHLEHKLERTHARTRQSLNTDDYEVPDSATTL